jgi:hypothetical protein
LITYNITTMVLFVVYLLAGFLGADIGHFVFNTELSKGNPTTRILNSFMISLFLTLLYLFIIF